MNGVIKNKTANETLPIILEDQILVLYNFFSPNHQPNSYAAKDIIANAYKGRNR